MKNKAVINNVNVTSKEWKRGDSHKIYFTCEHNRGRACWDVARKEWEKVHGEVSIKFKDLIHAEFLA